MRTEATASEYQFQPQLNLARTGGCARDLARRGTDTVGGKDVRFRKTEVSSVCNVKKFSPKQHTRPFLDWNRLEHREIEFRQTRPIRTSRPTFPQVHSAFAGLP